MVGSAHSSVIFFFVLEACIFIFESKSYSSDGTVSVFCDDDFRFSSQICSVFGGEDFVVCGAMDENHHVGVLFDGTGLAEVAQLRSFVRIRSLFDASVQL